MRRPDPQPYRFLLHLSAGILLPRFLLVAQTNPKLESAYDASSRPAVTLAQRQDAASQASSASAQTETQPPAGSAAERDRTAHDLTTAPAGASAKRAARH